MQEVLFRAYFTDGQNVSSDEVLKELAREVGLDVDKAMEALRDTEAVRDFEKGVKDAQTKGTYVFFFQYCCMCTHIMMCMLTTTTHSYRHYWCSFL